MDKKFTYAFTKKLFLLGLVTLFAIARVFAQAPVIGSFSPASGPVGTTVTITGTGFAPAAASNLVFFGATMATVTSASATSLTVTVPVSATYQPITVLNGNTALIGYSSKPFNTTFTPNKGSITAEDFNPRVTFVTSGACPDIVVGDLDGDGKPDIAMANSYSNVITIFQNISASGSITANSFGGRISIPVGTNPGQIAIADIDGDGKLDLVVGNDVGGNISVLRNISTVGSLSTGSFATGVNFATNNQNIVNYGQVINSLVLRDLDGDGKVDIVVSNNNSIISIFRNTSTFGSITASSFASRVDLNTGVAAQAAMAVGDLDGDGKPDLAFVTPQSNTVSVMRNNTSAGSINVNSFAAPVAFTTGTYPNYLAIADLDGDGKPELITDNWKSCTLSILQNTSVSGSITATSFAAKVDIPSSCIDGSSGRIAIGDLDGDGKPDIVATNGYNTSVFRNTSVSGAITASSFAPKVDLLTGAYSFGVAIADFDGDGKADLAVTNSYTGWQANTLSILHSNPFFTPTSQAVNVTFSNTSANSTTASWTNGAGLSRAVFIAQVAAGNPSPVNNITYAANPVFEQGDQIGSSGWYCVYNGKDTSVNITGLASGATYRAMAVEYNGTAGSENYLTTASTGNPANVTTLPGGSTVIDSISLVTASTTTANVVQYAVTFATPITGLSAINFVLIPTGTISGASITSISGSGANYIVTVNTGTGSGTLQLNYGDPTGILPTVTTKTQFAGAIYTIDRSVHPAPVIFSFSPSIGLVGTSVTITGTGFNATAGNNIVFFGATQATVTAASTTSLTVKVPAGATYRTISVLNGGTALVGFSEKPFVTTFTPNKGDITTADFQPPVSFQASKGAGMVAISDLDGDGKPDMVVANSNANSISVFRNVSTSGSITANSFASKVDFPAGNAPNGVAIADFDGDGKPDIAITNTLDNTVSVFRNTSAVGTISASSFAPGVNFVAGPYHVFFIKTGDFDGDGKPDIVVESSHSTDQINFKDTISIFRNTSTVGSITANSFAPPVNFGYGLKGNSFGDIAVGDLDGDGKPDIAVAAFESDRVALFRNTSTIGSINTNSFAPVAYVGIVAGPLSVAIGDLDGDGKPDLAVSGYGPIYVLRNTSIPGYLSQGTFDAPVEYSASSDGGIAIGDIDGDGKPDLVAGSLYSPGGVISILRNTSTIGTIGSTSFAQSVGVNIGYNALGITLADLDGDGRTDLIAGSGSVSGTNLVNQVVVMRNNPFFPPNNIIFTNTGTNSTTATWTNGTGTSRALFVALGSTGSPVPLNNTDYTANAVFTSGTQIGNSGWYCVYNGTGNTVNIAGLSSGATYRAMVVEYYGSTGSENYLPSASTGNPANVTTISGEAIAIDSINRVTAVVTNAATVQYKAIFLNPITGLTAGDFALSTTGNISGASVSSLTGSGSNYIITVNTGTGNGTIGLNLAGATGVLPGIVSPLPFTGQAYMLDRTPPSITISNPSDSLILSGTSKKVTYKVTYADSNFKASTLSVSDITLNRTGSATGTISLSGSDTTYTVTISNITGSGSLGISIGAGTASDQPGNLAQAAGPSKTFLIAPVLVNLALDVGPIGPLFADTTLTYVAVVNNGVNTATITPTLTDPNATVTVEGGSPSTPVSLAVGLNVITVKVTTLDGKATTTYTVGISRALPTITGKAPDISYGNGSVAITNNRAFSVTPTNKGGAVPPTDYGQVTTFAGSPTEAPGYINDVGTAALFNWPQEMVSDALGNLYVADANNQAIRMITPSGLVTTFAGSLTGLPGFSDGQGNSALFNFPDGLAIDASENLFVSDYSNNAIRKITPVGAVTTFYSTTNAFGPGGLCIDALGNLIVTAQDASQIIRITPAGVASVLAGSTPGYANGPSLTAQFNAPGDVKIDTAGNLYVADFNNSAIRKITPAGQVTTIAGSDAPVVTPGFADGAGTASLFNYPTGLHVAPGGVIYVADLYNNDVRRIMPDGTVSLIAGNASQVQGDADGVGTAAQFNLPDYVYIDGTGTGYVSEIGGNHIKKLVLTGYTLKGALPVGLAFDPTTGIISGTPTIPFTATTDTVTAFNAFGYSTTIFHINYQLPSTVATLSNLVPNSGALTPVFASGMMNYTVGVPNSIASITLTPTATDSTATIKVNGVAVVTGTASGSIPLAVGPNTVTIVVTAQDSVTTDTYTVNVNRAALSTIATLNGLTISNGTLTPAFATGTMNYSASVANNVSSITVTPTTSDANATIKVNGILVSSGSASGSIPLAAGPNTITTVVTAQDGTTVDTYTVVVTRTPSSDATLTNLAVSQGTLTPAFSSSTSAYTDNVPHAITSITVTPTASDSTATITVNGAAVASGTASGSIPLAIGLNTITTVVTAQDGITTDTYTVNVNRAADANATLSNLTVSHGTLTPAFSSSTSAYTDNVPNATTNVTVTPTSNDSTATIKVNGAVVASGTASAAIPLAVGPNTITTVVTAQDGTTIDTYTVVVTRAPSSDASVTSLTVSEGTLAPAFNVNTTAYTDTVSNLVTNLTVTTTTSDQNATITVNGTAVVNGSPSGAITLGAGENTITVIITAQDGTTTNTYTITVYRGESMGSIDATNVLTPNGDGKNDYWLIKDIELYPQNNVTVYDKAGRAVYTKHGYNNEWDGTSNGSPLAEGTYYFVVDLGPNLRKFKGFVSILRN